MSEDNYMLQILKQSIFTIILLAGLSACGGSGGDDGISDRGVDAVNPGDDPAVIVMGTQIGHTFTSGVIEIADSSIFTGETTTAKVYLKFGDGEAVTTQVGSVTFSSPCVVAGTATITSPATVSSGTATVTYKAMAGCSGTDVITANASYDGSTLSATGSIVISAVKIGSLAGSTFTADTLKLSSSTISAEKSTTITVNFVDATDTLVPNNILSDVTFSSACIAALNATITSPVSIVSGSASTTYNATGCTGADTVTATATYNGTTLTATGVITVAPFKMGAQIGHTFTEGSLVIADNTVSPIGSTTVTVYLVDKDDVPIATGIENITFSSPCVIAETATISSPVKVTSGIATATYKTVGCAGSDTITAHAIYGNDTLEAEGTLSVGTVRIGSFNGSGTFIENTINVSVSNISSGGETDVSVFFVDENDSKITDSIISEVAFSSSCISQNMVNINTPTTVASGMATTLYEADGCEGDDIVTATAVLNGSNLTATGTISIAAQAAGSISFISATPANISIQGAGGAGRSETSDVKFQVLSADGDPIEGETVAFSTNTSLGGLSLSPVSVDSDKDGYVQTTVSSGAIPTPVTVIAKVSDNTAIATQSSGLVVSTGLPDQDSMSMSLTTHNVEGLDYNGEKVTVSVWLSDNTNNPVPDGTTVSFITEGGQIETSCEISDGSCSVTWQSTEPRPIDGRVTILAYAEGQESFTDLNSSGRFDEYTTGNLESFDDKPEVWLDKNENGVRDAATEPFFDSGVLNGVYDGADGLFNGYLCNDTSCENATKSIHVRSDQVLVMSGSDAVITPTAISSIVGGGAVGGTDCILLNDSSPAVELTFTVTDENNQQMPKGTTVAISTSQGTVTLLTGETPWPDSNDPSAREYTASLVRAASAGAGYLTIIATTPKGTETKYIRCITEE